MATYFVTKSQLALLIHAWGVSAPFPGKGKQVIIAFPKPSVLNMASITVHDKKSTYGKLLYKVSMYTANS